MALPKTVGDTLQAGLFVVQTKNQPGPLASSADLTETAVSVFIQALPTNGGKIYVGDSGSQPVQLVANATISFDITRPGQIYIKGDTVNDQAAFLILRALNPVSPLPFSQQSRVKTASNRLFADDNGE